MPKNLIGKLGGRFRLSAISPMFTTTVLMPLPRPSCFATCGSEDEDSADNDAQGREMASKSLPPPYIHAYSRRRPAGHMQHDIPHM